MDKIILKTQIEKEVYKLVDQITERAYDFVHVFIMKNRLEIDKAAVEKTLELVKLANNDTYMNSIDKLHSNIESLLNKFIEETVPEEEEVPLVTRRQKK